MSSIEALTYLVASKTKRLRSEHRITITMLSKATGLSIATISRIENQQSIPTLQQVLLISNYFSIPIQEFLRIENEEALMAEAKMHDTLKSMFHY